MSLNNVEELRVLELYSGIGGMHWALKESGVKYEVVFAVDINTIANQIYKHNFPDVNLNSFGIEKITLKKLHSLRLNTILMSPPCQPFSRVGKKGDCDDVRTKSFLHILQLIRQMDEKPKYILVENVKGFETSRTRAMLMETLDSCHYCYQEFLLTPLQFQVPNSRLRYYMIAKLGSESTSCMTQASQIQRSLPEFSSQDSNHKKENQLAGKIADSNTPSVPQSSSPVCCAKLSSDVHERQTIVEEEIKSKRRCLDRNNLSTMSCTNSPADTTCFDNSPTKFESKKSIVERPELPKKLSRGETVAESGAQENDGFCRASLNGDTDTSCSNSELQKLLDAGRNMRFCEETDTLMSDHCFPLQHYMEDYHEEDGEYEHLLVKDKSLRQFVVMDIVLPSLKKSTCFTKRYGHYIEGAGSLVQMSSSSKDTRLASEFKSKVVELKNKNQWGEEELSVVRKLKLRYFSPREVANLLCFPKEFTFPDGVTTIQKYRCLGNSLNVHVVARLIRLLTASVYLT